MIPFYMGGMMKVTVEVKPDHLERMVHRHSPLSAMAELIWNAVDSDANHVDISLLMNKMAGLQEIHVNDNGHGISHELAKTTFKSLGDSWKKSTRQSPAGRQLHGRSGEGRFAAFALGDHVRWNTRWRNGQSVQAFHIIGSKAELRDFDISEPVASGTAPGTDVIITEIQKSPRSLLSEEAPERLSEILALYLRTYPEIRISYNGTVLDPKSVEDRVVDIKLPDTAGPDGTPISASLTVIEWKRKVDRALHLCDTDGFTLVTRPPGIQAPGFHFTAYLKSAQFRAWHESGELELDDLHPEISSLVEAAKSALREYFRKRSAENARGTVEEWKAQQIYPYRGSARDAIEEAERQVFDVVALNLNEYLPGFASSDAKAKKFSLQMLRSAIERSPQDAQRIIQEVLELPKEKQEELAGLLQRTTLASIISASKIVGDRLDYLAGLDAIIFHAEGKRRVRERKHLHRLMAENTWLFGEEFNLSVDDEALTEVLKKHLEFLGCDRLELAPVTTIDDATGIVDLMLSRRVPQPKVDEREHLVIEIKRPSHKINGDDLNQIEKYAFAVAEDERFRDANTRWIFWLVSNDMSGHVRRKVTKQADRPDGLHHRAEDHRLTIWVKTWGQIIDACKARLNFFETKLKYMASHDTGLDYLRRMHAQYLPEELRVDDDANGLGHH